MALETVSKLQTDIIYQKIALPVVVSQTRLLSSSFRYTLPMYLAAIHPLLSKASSKLVPPSSSSRPSPPPKSTRYERESCAREERSAAPIRVPAIALGRVKEIEKEVVLMALEPAQEFAAETKQML